MNGRFVTLLLVWLAGGLSGVSAQATSSLVIRAGEKEESVQVELQRQPHFKIYLLVESEQAGKCLITIRLLARGGPLAVPVKDQKIEVSRIATGKGLAVFQLESTLPPGDKTVSYVLLAEGEISGSKTFRKLIQIQLIGKDGPQPVPVPGNDGKKQASEEATGEKL